MEIDSHSIMPTSQRSSHINGNKINDTTHIKLIYEERLEELRSEIRRLEARNREIINSLS